MVKALSVVAGVLALALAGAAYGLLETRERLGSTLARAEAVEALLEAERAWNDRIRYQVQVVQEQYDDKSIQLQEALDEHQDWGSTVVPGDVRDGLCAAGVCTETGAGTVQAPED